MRTIPALLLMLALLCGAQPATARDGQYGAGCTR